MYKLLRILLFPFILLSMSASGQVRNKAYNKLLNRLLSHSVDEISVVEASQLKENVIFLDARELKEYKVSHLENALLVGYDHFDINTVRNIPKDQKIIVYCAVGYRSEKITEKLIKAGYMNASNLYGGIFEWKNEGYQAYDSTGVTEKTHVFSKKWGNWLEIGDKVF